MLSEEEKKSIEKLSNGEKIELISLIRIFKREGIENFVITRKEYIETVLNLITKLQKENEILKRAFDKQTADMSNNLLELQQKDKQIDLMARAFKQDDVRSVEEIKEYFEKQAKEKGE